MAGGAVEGGRGWGELTEGDEADILAGETVGRRAGTAARRACKLLLLLVAKAAGLEPGS